MDKILKKPVKEFMTKKVITVAEGDLIKKAFELFDKHGIVGAPVTNEKGEVAGIITETDLIKHFTTLKTPRSINLLGGILYLDDISSFNENLKDQCSEFVKDLMVTDVITLKENQSLGEAVDTMSEKRISRLPIVDSKGTLKGIISRSDIVHQIAKSK